MTEDNTTEPSPTEESPAEESTIELTAVPFTEPERTQPLSVLAEKGVRAWGNNMSVTVLRASRLHMDINKRQPLGSRKRVPPMIRQYAKLHNLAFDARQRAMKIGESENDADDEFGTSEKLRSRAEEVAIKYELKAADLMAKIDIGMRTDVKMFMEYEVKMREQLHKEKKLKNPTRAMTGAEKMSEEELQEQIEKYGSDD